MRLCSFNEEKIKVNYSALDEMHRLQTTKLHIPDTLPTDFDVTTFRGSYLNVRSLKEHYLDLESYKIAEIADIFCLSETKVHNYTIIHLTR